MRLSYLRVGDFPAVGVHGGHDVDTGGAEEFVHHLVAGQVTIAQIHGQFEQHLPGHHLVTVHVTDVLELWFHYKQKKRSKLIY